MMKVANTAFRDIKYDEINTKSETSNASEKDIGIKNLISPGMKSEPIRTAAPTAKAAIPVALPARSVISPINSVKKLKEVTLSKLNKEFKIIDPREHPASTLQICPVAMKNKSIKIKSVRYPIIFPILSKYLPHYKKQPSSG